jgi:hypothetical protein
MLDKQFSPIEQQKDLDEMWNYLGKREGDNNNMYSTSGVDEKDGRVSLNSN